MPARAACSASPITDTHGPDAPAAIWKATVQATITARPRPNVSVRATENPAPASENRDGARRARGMTRPKDTRRHLCAQHERQGVRRESEAVSSRAQTVPLLEKEGGRGHVREHPGHHHAADQGDTDEVAV